MLMLLLLLAGALIVGIMVGAISLQACLETRRMSRDWSYRVWDKLKQTYSDKAF